MVARRAHNPKVAGSSPVRGATHIRTAHNARVQPSGKPRANAPQPRRLLSDSWYRLKLARRLGGVTICLLLTMLISHVALATAPGQVLDTILMEGTMRSASRYESFSMLITGIVSVPVMVRRHARMRLPPEQGKGLVDSGPIIP